MSKLGVAGDRFSEFLCVDCAILYCVSGYKQFTNTQFARLNTKISSSKYDIMTHDKRLTDGWPSPSLILVLLCTVVALPS